jgi:aminoglycoside 3-N-acetyltransferase
MPYTEREVERCLHSLGIGDGDTVFVHAAMKALGPLQTPNDNPFEALLGTFLSIVGAGGTIVVPTFNFGFCRGEPFDVQNTPGEGMGQFSEYVRKRPEAQRSRHPFQSVAAIGKQASWIAAAKSRTAFSGNGAFDRMLALDAKILFFGVPFVETFVHIAEERAAVDYRFWKTFEADLIDNGTSERIKVEFFARHLDIVPEPRIDNGKLLSHFVENGILRRSPLGEGHVAVANATALVNDLVAIFRSQPRFALRA